MVTPSTRGESRRDASVGPVLWHPDDEVDHSSTVRAQLVHLFEPERSQAIVRIDEVLVGAVRASVVRIAHPAD